MALCRCINHLPPIATYIHYVVPIDFPNTSSICGIQNCVAPGYIWLNAADLDNFNQQNDGIVVFPTNVIKVKTIYQVHNR